MLTVKDLQPFASPELFRASIITPWVESYPDGHRQAWATDGRVLAFATFDGSPVRLGDPASFEPVDPAAGSNPPRVRMLIPDEPRCWVPADVSAMVAVRAAVNAGRGDLKGWNALDTEVGFYNACTGEVHQTGWTSKSAPLVTYPPLQSVYLSATRAYNVGRLLKAAGGPAEVSFGEDSHSPVMFRATGVLVALATCRT